MFSCNLLILVCILFIVCPLSFLLQKFVNFFIVMKIHAKGTRYFLAFVVHLYPRRFLNFLKQWFLAAGSFLLLSRTGFFKSSYMGTTLRWSVFFYPVPWINLYYLSQNEIHVWVHYLHWIYLSLLFAEIWIYFEFISFFLDILWIHFFPSLAFFLLWKHMLIEVQF